MRMALRMPLRDMQIPKSEKKKFLAPPLPNPGDAPDGTHFTNNTPNDTTICNSTKYARLLVKQFRIKS